MRTIKTTIAVLLTICIAQILNLKSPLLAVIAAIVTMQSNVINSLEGGKNRLLGTVVGAIIGLGFSLISPSKPVLGLFLIGIGVVLVITVCDQMNWDESVTIALIVFLSVMIVQEHGERLSYSINRIIATFLGVVIATFINILVSPPDMEKRILSVSELLLDECDKLLKDILQEKEILDLNKIKSKLENIEKYYAVIKDESNLKIYKNNIESKNIEDIIILFKGLYVDLHAMSDIRKNSNKDNEIINNYVYSYHLKRAEEALDKLKGKINNMCEYPKQNSIEKN